jgi:hypothetical protein
MVRELTKEELQILKQVQAALRLRGIQIDDTEEGNKNATSIMKPFEDSNAPVTLDGILSVVNQLAKADRLLYTSKIAKQFNLLLVQMTADEATNLQDFLSRKPLEKLGTEGGFHNAVLLVEWLRRYKFPINFEYLSKALEGFTYSTSMDPKQLLRWLDTGMPIFQTRQDRHQDDEPTRRPGELFTEPKKTDGPRYVNGRLNHATDTRNQPKPVKPLDETERRWKQMADDEMGKARTHSQKAELQEAYDNALGSSYRKVYEAVAKVAKRHQVVRG